MPNRLSKILSRSSAAKDKEAEAEAERNNSSSSSPPPGYAEAPPDYDAENTVVPPDATLGFSNLSLNRTNNDTPQVDHCIAHLKVLECFYRLRQKIGATDGLFGIKDSIVTGQGLPDSDKKSELLAKLSEKRWAIYVSRAVDRFATWSASITPGATMLTNAEFERFGPTGALCNPNPAAPPIQLDASNLPPADVLMVYHAYMLNPRDFLEDCLRLGRMQLWHSGFPWQPVVDSINSQTFIYEAGEQAANNFTSLTGLPWDQLDDPRQKQLTCPVCEKALECEFTFAGKHLGSTYSSWESLARDIDDDLSIGLGFCDKDFTMSCPGCGTGIDHDRLRVGKFCQDIKKLITQDVPMGGTLLGYEGIPWRYGTKRDPMFISSAITGPFANKLLEHGLGKDILRDVMLNKSKHWSMTDMRDSIEARFAERTYMKVVRGSPSGRMSKTDRISVRKMMSRYWENSSPFALDLVGAVIRQGSFIEKMHNIDWIHSPALPSTMKRLLVKYRRFVSIMNDKTHMAVPTLDVDLAWHTHQLSPPAYMDYTIRETGQFIDHDDKVAETALNDAFAWTSKTYQKQYGEPYSECTCWYCEAIRESHTNTASRLFNSSNNQAAAKLHDAEQDPRKSIHISTHNAVRPAGDADYDKVSKQKAAELESHYQKACERARKKGRKEPKRDDYYWSDAYGYPVYIPAYSPYFGFYPYMPMYYPVTPGCMALGAGAAGNCCQGTCGGKPIHHNGSSSLTAI
jgi:hypothetical protein